MSQKVDLLKVFISCPGDVDDERKIIRDVCKSVSTVTSRNKAIEVKPIDYIENIIPQITGKEAQFLIEEQLEQEKYDIYIGIMWHRFGDTLSIGATPTEKEFNSALDRYKETGSPLIQFYFKDAEYTPVDDDEKDQVKKVSSFKSRIKYLGLYKSFQNSLKFQESVNEFISSCVEKFQINQSLNCPIQKNQYEMLISYLTRSVVKNPKDDMASFFYEEKIYDLVEVIKENNKVILVGDAGIGKTSELNRVANYYANKETIYYPFRVPLNTYIDSDIEELFNPNCDYH